MNVEPQLYRYGTQGNLEATGRVAGSEIMSGEGEPYFVERDAAGRVARVYYPDFTAKDKPEMEMRYTYTVDGKLKQVAAIDMESAYKSEYGPERYVVQFHYDDAGRLVRKVVRDNAVQDEIETRYESDYQYDGRGQMTRDRTIKYVAGNTERMQVMQDIQTTYDLGGNPTEIKFYDNYGWAYTETRTYARGYQLTGFTTSEAADVTVNTASTYTYDTNNNLTGTKKLDAYVAADDNRRIAFRAKWSFIFDRKNRMKIYSNGAMDDDLRFIWYDGLGRVWQRWTYDANSETWDATLTRFVYDGALVQEHQFDVEEVESSWVYSYDQILQDYLREPGGIRQRDISTADQSETDRFLLSDRGQLTARIERETSSTVQRMELTASGSRQAGGSEQDTQISNLASSGTYIESYGGGTSGATQYFDPLQQVGESTYLTELGVAIALPWILIPLVGLLFIPGSPADLEDCYNGPCGCPECCWDWPSSAWGCVKRIGIKKPCLEFMCCHSCPKSITVGFSTCAHCQRDPHCREKCCDNANYVYECLEDANYIFPGMWSCGGNSGDPGSCWDVALNDPNVIQYLFWQGSCPLDFRATLLPAIKKMCRQLNDTGCLARCDRYFMCAFFKNRGNIFSGVKTKGSGVFCY